MNNIHFAIVNMYIVYALCKSHHMVQILRNSLQMLSNLSLHYCINLELPLYIVRMEILEISNITDYVFTKIIK